MTEAIIIGMVLSGLGTAESKGLLAFCLWGTTPFLGHSLRRSTSSVFFPLQDPIQREVDSVPKSSDVEFRTLPGLDPFSLDFQSGHPSDVHADRQRLNYPGQNQIKSTAQLVAS